MGELQESYVNTRMLTPVPTAFLVFPNVPLVSNSKKTVCSFLVFAEAVWIRRHNWDPRAPMIWDNFAMLKGLGYAVLGNFVNYEL